MKFAGGLNIDFYDDPRFKDSRNATGDANYQINARNFFRFLLYGYRPTYTDVNLFASITGTRHPWQNLLSKELHHVISVERDPKMLEAFRHELQDVLTRLFTSIKEDPNLLEDDGRLKQFELILYNLLALYPFSDPTPNEILYVPTQIDSGVWVMLPYKVEPIELTPTTTSLRGDIQDCDRVFCYGLCPVLEEVNVPRILIFMGTTYPTGQGKKVQDYTNCMPDREVGEQLYLWGKDKVFAWLDQTTQDTSKVISTGASLGGILASMFALAKPVSFENVYAFNPPGFMKLPDAGHPEFKPWFQAGSNDKPNVIILSQEGDPVSSAGFFVVDSNITLLRTKLPTLGAPQLPIVNGYIAHLVIHAAHHGVEIHTVDIPRENCQDSRTSWTRMTNGIIRPVMWFFARDSMPTLAATTSDDTDEQRAPAQIHTFRGNTSASQ